MKNLTIKLKPETLKALERYAKQRGYPDLGDCADELIDYALARLKALARYKGKKPSKKSKAA